MREYHGRTGTKLYKAWKSMKGRCLNKNERMYPRYGGRGITICDQWINSFATFVRDMGERPAGAMLERVNNDGPYSHENCVWATPLQQAHNRVTTRLISFDGKTMCIRDWERELGLGTGTLWRRLDKGLPLEQALRRIDQ